MLLDIIHLYYLSLLLDRGVIRCLFYKRSLLSRYQPCAVAGARRWIEGYLQYQLEIGEEQL
jgi:hypothetical protein